MKITAFKFIALMAIPSIILIIGGCTKNPDNSKKLIDDIVGTYIAYDTSNNVPQSLCGGYSYDTYSFIVSKETETTINISKIQGCENVKATVSDNNITLITSSSCDNFTPAVSRDGNGSLHFSYTFIAGAGCTGTGTITAIKQ